MLCLCLACQIARILSDWKEFPLEVLKTVGDQYEIALVLSILQYVNLVVVLIYKHPQNPKKTINVYLIALCRDIPSQFVLCQMIRRN